MELTYERMRGLAEKYDIKWCEEYGEPGYAHGGSGILFANWNDVPDYLSNAFERSGYSIEWSDEWMIDYNRNMAYRTCSDSYFWKPSLIFLDGDIFTIDDARDDPETYINEILANDVNRIDCFGMHKAILSAGFELLEDSYYSGWYPGQTDSPQTIAEKIWEQNSSADIVFGQLETSQFYVGWKVYVRYPETLDEEE